MSAPSRIAVTGAGGFIGSALLRALDRRAGTKPELEVRALVRTPGRLEPRPWLTEVKGDLCVAVPSALCAHEPEVVVHLATKGIDRDGSGYEATNVQGSRRLLEALSDSVRALLYTSSISVYGQGAQRGEPEVRLALGPTTRLAETRATAEALFVEGMAARGASAICTRARYVLGAGDQHTLPGLLRLTRSGWSVASGEQRFSVIDVDDYAELLLGLAAHRLAADAPFRGAVHVACREGLSLNALQAALAAAWGLRVPRRRIWLPGPVLTGLNALPSRTTRRWAQVYELFGLDHWVGVDRLASWLGPECVARDPRDVLATAIAWLRAR